MNVLILLLGLFIFAVHIVLFPEEQATLHDESVVLNMLCRVTTLVAHCLQWGPHVGTGTQGLSDKSDTAILIRMERLGV